MPTYILVWELILQKVRESKDRARDAVPVREVRKEKNCGENVDKSKKSVTIIVKGCTILFCCICPQPPGSLVYPLVENDGAAAFLVVAERLVVALAALWAVAPAAFLGSLHHA